MCIKSKSSTKPHLIITVLLFCWLFNSSNSILAQPANDNYASAIDLTAIIGSCSADAAYTTISATSDLNKGTCWNNSGPRQNVWFKFTAPVSGMINITVDIDGSKGTQQRTQLALWESDGTTQIVCDAYNFNSEDVTVASASLTPGSTYYISVDTYNSGFDGTFTMCLADTPDYDLYEGAEDVTAYIGGCSPDAAYTTVGAGGDLNKGSCWNNSGPRYNRWFKFTAPASGIINITVDIGGSKGTQQRTQLALWESDGTTQVDCDAYNYNNEDVNLNTTGLTPGSTYYISVDTYNSGYYGSFTLCLDDAADYDLFEGAEDVTAYIGGCSPDAAYTTVGAGGDLNKGSCWNNSGPRYNRWFKFTAPASGVINITVDIDGSKGTQQRTQLALWESDGTTQVDCDAYNYNNEDVNLNTTGLTPGSTYYISVDTYNSGYYGSFTLCLDDAADYDLFEGAEDVTAYIGGCSPDAAYTTVGAGGDLNKGTCWNNSGPRYNRWFKFTAPASGMINITVDIGGSKGTQQRTQLALWESDGTTQVDCDAYNYNNEDVNLNTTGLTPGSTYYISVDTYNSGYYGSFTLCLDDAADYDLFEGAEDVTAYIGGCSPDAAYTTVGAGGDLNKGTCWNNSGPRYNRWFKFTAPASGMINITVDIGGSKGTQQRTQLALWESDGTTQVDCDIYNFNSEDVNLNTTGLTPGSTYYISVDTYNSGYYGSFTLCLADAPDYDLFEGAKDVTAYIGGCSPNAAYTTVGAGGDLNKGTCWNNSGPRYNRWFKFTAPASGMINITVDIGGSKGTQQRTQLALWENDGTTQIACDIYNFNNEDVEVGATSLIPGSVYYFSVDTYNSGYYGSFSLCLEDKPSYDYFEGAIELTDLNNWCSADGEYSTVGGTADKNKGSCWNNSGPRYNRWFKFTAVTNNVTISVEVGGSDGTQQRTQLALWESDGTTQIQCDKYISNSDDVALSDATLVVGNEYYISVDTYNSGYYGSFKLCIDNIDTEYYSISDGDWDDVNNWSIVSHVGAAAASYPIDGDVAYIQGHQITANVAQNCAEINLNIADDNSKLIIDGVAFNVAGQVNMTNSGNDFDGEIKLQNAGTLYINDALTMTRDGGANPFKIEIENGSTVTVNKDLTINSSSGTINNNEINLNGNAILTIRKDLELNHTGGIKSQITANSTSRILVEKDLSFTATTDDRVEIELNNSAQMKVKGSFNLGSPAYGIMDFNNTSTLEFNGTNIQSLPSFDGSGTGDFFDVNRIIINNTFGAAPQLSLTDDITIGTSLTLTKGVIDGNSYSITIPSGASISSGNASSYIDGALKIVGNSNANFPIGDGEVWAPLELKNLTGDAATEFTAQYLFEDFGDNSVTGILNNASILEYWTIDNTGTASNADVTLHWKSAARSEISDYADLVIAHYDGSDWENLGQSSIVSSSSGSITVSGVSSFSPFTFGSLSDDKNFLPITLGEFNLQAIKNQVLISWTTESEINNNFFTIEKSSNGSPFYPIGNVEGSGNSNRELNYHFYDQNPNVGVSYYRLKQTDFNGHYEYFEPKAIHFSFISSVPLQVYPNPTNNVVNIIMNPVDENNFIELKNTSGKTLFETQILQSNTEIQMPSEKGIYILYIHQGDDLIVKKIIKL